MTRLTGPDEAGRAVWITVGPDKGKLAAQGLTAVIYADQALTTLADIQTTAGVAIPGSSLTVDEYSQIPLFKYPDGVDTVYTSIAGGPVTPLYARTDDRLDAVGETLATTVLKSDVTGPADGVADATSAFTAAAAAAVAEGRDYIRVAPGLYHCPGMTAATISNCYVIGDGVTFTPSTYVYPFTTAEFLARGARVETAGGNGAISFVVDDAVIAQWEDLFPLTKRLGISIGVAWVTNNGAGATWLPEAYRHGWEILSHTIDHGQVTSLTASQIEAMAESTLASIEAITGSRENVGFVYPQHVRSAETDRILSKYFAYGRGSAVTRLYPPTGGREWLTAAAIMDTEFGNGFLTETVKDMLRNVARTNGRQAFYFHWTTVNGEYPDPTAFTEMVEFARHLGIQIVLPRELWTWNNLTMDPYDELGTKWTLGSNFTRSTDFAYKGADSFKFTAGGGFTSGLVTSKLINAAPNPGMFSVYRASYRRKNESSVSISSGWGIYLSTGQTARNVDGSTTSVGTSLCTTKSPASGTTIAVADWERTSFAVYVAPCVEFFNLRLELSNIAGGSVPIYFDELKLELIDHVTTANFQATLNGTTGVKVTTGVPFLSRHAITLQPRTPIAGRLSYTLSANDITVVSTDAADTAVVDIVVQPGPSYNNYTFPTAGA